MTDSGSFSQLPNPSPTTDTATWVPSAAETGVNRLSLKALSRDPGKAGRLVPWGLAWFTTSSLGTHPSSLREGQSQGGEECSHQAMQHSQLFPHCSCLEKRLPNLVCIRNTSFPIQGLAQNPGILGNEWDPVLSGSRNSRYWEEADSFTHIYRDPQCSVCRALY